MEFAITIDIPISDLKLCQSVLRSVAPDNIGVPLGIEIYMECVDAELKIVVRGVNVKVLTYRNTVDDLLEHISIAYRSLIYVAEEAKDNARF